MRLRYQFVVREVDGTPVAVAVGRDNEKFNGMIKLNTTGGVIFKMLSEGNPTQQELLHQLAHRFGIEEETVRPSVLDFLEQLRQNGLLDETAG